MFERFTASARGCVVEAQVVARAKGDDSIACRHLLLALATRPGPAADVLGPLGLTGDALDRALRDLDGVTAAAEADALSALGIDLSAVRKAAEERFGLGALEQRQPKKRPWFRRVTDGHIPFTPKAKRALEMSLRECLRLGGTAIEAEFLLLGVLAAGDPQVDAVLARCGTTAQAMRAAVEDSLRRSA